MSDDRAAPPIYFYEPVPGGIAPTRLPRGLWDRRYQTGVALAGLTAHLVEETPALAPMVITRFTMDLLKPTPMAPVEPRVTLLRNGKRLQLLEVELVHEDEVTVKAIALRVRTADSPRTESPRHGPPPAEPRPGFDDRKSPFSHIVQTRMESGGMEELGDGVQWVRFDGEIVRGKPITPFVQMAMASDFGSGLSSFVDWREWTYANVDISLHLTRMPEGPWMRLASHSDSAGNGIAVVDTTLSDLTGDVGHAHQTLFLDRRQP